MNAVIKLLLKAMALRALKRQGELLYLKALDATRRGIRYTFLLIVMAQILLVGLALTLYASFQILPIDEAARPYWMLGAGLLMTLVPLIVVLWGTSDQVWFKATHSRRRS